MASLTVTVSPAAPIAYTVTVTPSSYTLGSNGGTVSPIVNVMSGSTPVTGATVTIQDASASISGTGITDSNGDATVNLTIPPNSTSTSEIYTFAISASSGSSTGGGGGLPSGTYPIEYAGTYGNINQSSSDPKVGTGNVTVSDGSALGYYSNAPYYLSSSGDYYTLVSSAASGGTKTLVIKYGTVTFSIDDGSIEI